MSTTSSPELRRLLDEAPFVSSLARALAGHDADEVVQGTWLRAMESDALEVRRPRLWLSRVVRSVAHNLRRGRARRRAHERAAARRDHVPSSVELMEREERRRELVQAVDSLPGPLRAVVLLRFFEELPLRAIARQLDIPVATAHGRLQSALTILRRRLDERHEDRRAWLLPVLPPRAAASALAAGILAMTAKAKVVAAFGVLVLATLTVWVLDGPPGSPTPGPDGPGQPPPLTADASKEGWALGPETGRTLVATPPPPATGTLIVEATFEEDGAPVPGLVVMVGPPGGDHRFDPRRARTDGGGIARVEDLAPGWFKVWNARHWRASVRVEVMAGAETTAELVLPAGVAVTGVVVDADGVPVAGAQVHVGPPAMVDRDAEHVASSGADGRFALRSCPPLCLVGARAEGHSPSKMKLVHVEEGESVDLRLVLPAPGGTVEGLVSGPDGNPVADAVVVVGEGSTNVIPSDNEGAPPLPAQVRTDVRGRFRAIGVPEGEQPVQVRAADLAPWSGACRVAAYRVTVLQVSLERGTTCTGVVLDAVGAPVAGAGVAVGSYGDFAHWRARTDSDGAFVFHGLPPGDIELQADYETGKAHRTLHGGPGETVRCVLRLDRRVVLRGRVLSEDGDPVALALVEGRTDPWTGDARWHDSTFTDERGRFTIRSCPEGSHPTLRVAADGFRERRVEGVDPVAGELEVRLVRGQPASVRIVGVLVGPDGRAVPRADILVFERNGSSGGQARTDAGSGAFEIGPLLPGVWRFSVLARDDLPGYWSEWRTLGANAVWNAGRIRLPAGGTIVASVEAEPGLRPNLAVYDTTLGGGIAFRYREEPLRSWPLAPGRHLVMVGGRGVAQQLVPVEVRSGEETRIEVHARTGYQQRFQLEAPLAHSEIDVRIQCGDDLVTDFRSWSAVRREWERWLAPGDYTVTATGDGLSGQAGFTVRAGGNAVVRVVLR